MVHERLYDRAVLGLLFGGDLILDSTTLARHHSGDLVSPVYWGQAEQKGWEQKRNGVCHPAA